MRLTTKGRYAVTAMLDLALHKNQSPINLADISRRRRYHFPILSSCLLSCEKDRWSIVSVDPVVDTS